MKILLTGGGTGGHFYPAIAVAEELNRLAKEYKLIDLKLYYMAPEPYNEGLLYENNLTFIKSHAGKMRRYFSILNFFDLFKTAWGIVLSLWDVFNIYPDVIFGKGGYGSFPTLVAARILRIPVVIHESDTVPGRVNKWAGKFARRIALSFPEASTYFPKDKVAYTGNPIRKEVIEPLRRGAMEFLDLEKDIPVIAVLGGSQGSRIVNEVILNSLPKLLEKYQVIHQTGKENLREMKDLAEVILANSPYKKRYKPFDYLNTLAIRMVAGTTSLVISRSGSTIFEIASWGIPSILIPITDSHGDHQRKNAYAYAHSGAASVVEEKNLSPQIIIGEAERIIDNKETHDMMSRSASNFSRVDAARKIASEIIAIGLEHGS